jgi:N-acyl-D-amino-acid deacylase
VPELKSFDQIIPPLMQRYGIPGGAVAVTYQGRLVYARGYGYADTITKRTVDAGVSLFRIASVSKPITAVAIMKLVEQGKLDLEAKMLPLVPELAPAAGTSYDVRIADISVRQLLSHTSGWDRDRSGDPIFQNQAIAAALGVPAPASIRQIIKYVLTRPLDFAPGARYVYSNLGFSILGRIIENVAGGTYQGFVQANVLGPAGITRMRLGTTEPVTRPVDEVKYYDFEQVQSVFPGQGTVPFPDGGFYLESMDAHGGWIASAVDLVRFLTAVDGSPTRPDVISSSSLATMLTPPPSIWDGADAFYALGWLVRPNPGNWWHDGSLPGTASFVARIAGDITFAAVFNARQTKVGLDGFQAQIDPSLSLAFQQVTSWPVHDLFPNY